MAKPVYKIQDEEREERESKAMIKKHRRATRGEKLRSYPVGDLCNTVFLCRTTAKGEAAIAEYKRTHEIFWR